jgi:D-alanine-D-alanine ligase
MQKDKKSAGSKPMVLLLFGGRSTEHEVSVRSAENVKNALDREKYDLLLIGIDKRGRWVLVDDPDFFRNNSIVSYEEMSEVYLPPVPGSRTLTMVRKDRRLGPIDVVFPLLHGSFGEDGTVQGLLRLCDLPFVGADVLGSAVGMDKDFMRRLLREAGIPVPRFRAFRWCDPIDTALLRKDLGFPLFVKPANLGSSVGISRVQGEDEFKTAVEMAFCYDTKIVVEEEIVGREIECSVLGNESPVASVPGEIVPVHEFYSYEAKYIDEEGARLLVPADLKASEKERIQRLAVESFFVLGCEGLARVDFFLKNDGSVVVNEINTLPGFTSISMYPKLWVESGIAQSELVERLIALGFERHEREKRLLRSFSLPGE